MFLPYDLLSLNHFFYSILQTIFPTLTCKCPCLNSKLFILTKFISDNEATYVLLLADDIMIEYEQSDGSQTLGSSSDSSSSSVGKQLNKTCQREDHDTLMSEDSLLQISTDNASCQITSAAVPTTPTADTEVPQVCNFTFPIYSSLHVSKEYLEV